MRVAEDLRAWFGDLFAALPEFRFEVTRRDRLAARRQRCAGTPPAASTAAARFEGLSRTAPGSFSRAPTCSPSATAISSTSAPTCAAPSWRASSAPCRPQGSRARKFDRRTDRGSSTWDARGIEPSRLGAVEQIDRKRIAALTEAQQEQFRNRTGALGQDLRARRQGDAERRPLLLPGERPLAGLHRARQGQPRLGRRRQRVRRLPQRLRRDVHRPRQPDRRRRGQGADRRGHPLRRPHRRLDRRRRGAGAPLRPAAVALHQLRHRVDDGRRPPRPRRHRPRHDPQDRGLLPRPPRRGDGLRLPGAGGARRPRRPGQRPLRRRHAAGADRADPRRPLQRRRRSRERAGEDRRAGRRADHGAGDDEHQHHPAARGLPGAGPRADRRARRQADLRRGQDRRDDLRRRRHRSASASPPT